MSNPTRTLTEWLERLPDLKRAGSQHQGPCPVCGEGTDRFHIQKGHTQAVVAHCRVCEADFLEFARAVFPEDFERRNGTERKASRKLTASWPVCDYSGLPWAVIRRYDYSDGSKQVKPFRDGGGELSPGMPEGERYLFNGIATFRHAAAQVLVVEGEKCAAHVDAWREVDPTIPVPVSFIGGTGAPLDKHNLSCFKGRHVTVAADADNPGRKFAHKVECALAGIAESVTVCLPPGEDGRDVADFDTWAEAKAWLDKHTRKPGLPLRSLRQILAIPAPALDWLVEGLLVHNGLSLFSALAKAGKSTLIRCLAAVVGGGGGLWLGRECQGGRVIHLALEERLQTIQNHYRQIADEAALDNIHIMLSDDERPAEALKELEASIRAIKPALVIVDTMSRLLKIADYNAYRDTTSGLDDYIPLARRHATHLCFVHHTSAEGRRASGSEGLKGSVDAEMILNREGDTGPRYFHAFGRDDVHLEKTLIELGSDGWALPAGTKREQNEREIAREIIDALTEHGGLTLTELCQHVQHRRATVLDVCRQLVRDNELKTSGGTSNRADPLKYHV